MIDERPDVLDPDGVLGPSHRVADRRHPVGSMRRRDRFPDRETLVLRRTGDPRDDVERVAGIVLFQKLKDAVRILQRRIPARHAAFESSWKAQVSRSYFDVSSSCPEKTPPRSPGILKSG